MCEGCLCTCSLAAQDGSRTRFQPFCSSKEGKATSDRPNMGACCASFSANTRRNLGAMLPISIKGNVAHHTTRELILEHQCQSPCPIC